MGYERVAKNYEKGRPEYPEEAISILAKALKLEPDKQVLDLAAGTGKLTKVLKPTKAHLYAVEPVSSMRTVFHQQLPDVPILEGQAENIPFPSEYFDAVLVGTAFHWFNGEKALQEISRILKPGGGLGLIWNIFDEEEDWVREIRALWQMGKDRSPHDSFLWKFAFEKTALFSSLHHETFRYKFSGTRQDVLDRLFSAKIFGELSEIEQKRVVEKTLQFFDLHSATQGKKNLQIPYRIEMYWCYRL